MEFFSEKISISKNKTILGFVFCFIIFLSFFSGPNKVLAQWDLGTSGIEQLQVESAEQAKTGIKSQNVANYEKACHFLSTPGKCLILPLFYFSGTLLKISGILFVWIINTDNIKLVLTSSAVYEVWTYVRDLLNMAFIMVLLFSAFCTIFQIEQYNYKKLLWKIVLMALLVNFSFPITRFIIDASNILMYSIIKSDFFTDSSASSSLATIAEQGSLPKLLSASTWPDAASILGATVMLFMLAITFLAIGVLLLIRIIALALLIIFSPVAFAGSIIPGISAQASKWWDYLFKYSFFGPIMILGVAIAVKFMNGIGKELSDKVIAAAGGQSATGDSSFLGSMVFILVPIVLLWMVMGVAQSMSIAGAGAVMGKAQGIMKGVGKWTAKAPFKGIKKIADVSGVSGGIKQRFGEITGKFKSAQSRREAIVAASLGSKSAEEADMKKRAKELEETKSLAEIKELAKDGKDTAAVYALAKMKELDQATYTAFMAIHKNPRITDGLNAEVKKSRADLVAIDKSNDDKEIEKALTENPTWTGTPNQKRDQAKAHIINQEIGKLTAEKWADQDWNGISKRADTTPNQQQENISLHTAIYESFTNLKDPAKAEIRKRVSGNSVAALNTMGITV